MKEKREVRSQWIKFRVNDKEFTTIKGFCISSTSKGISEYARSVLLRKPVIVKYRNQSADEILAVMIQLKNELSAIGNNFNQSVHRLHMLDHIPEIKAWLLTSEMSRQSFMNKVEEIRQKMNEIYNIWSQK